jgi:hypothetical protein
MIANVIARKIVVPTPKMVPLQPPVASGVSLLASLPRLLTKGLQPILHDLHTELGSVFTVNLFGLKKVTFLVGPEVTAHLFQGPDSEICHPDMYKFTAPIFGKGILFDADFTTRSRQVHLCADAMKTAEMRSNIDSMVCEVQVIKQQIDACIYKKNICLSNIFLFASSGHVKTEVSSQLDMKRKDIQRYIIFNIHFFRNWVVVLAGWLWRVYGSQKSRRRIREVRLPVKTKL